MVAITFMSDFGADDHYVAAIKGKFLSLNAGQQVIDISHSVVPYDISHGAFILRSVFRDFPKGSVHLVSVDAVKDRSTGIAIELEGHFFVGFDCGLFSMISPQKPSQIVILDLGNSAFPAKEVLVNVAYDLANGGNLGKHGPSAPAMKELFARQLKATKREIVGNVMNVDHYGNLITNIPRRDFDTILEINGSGARFLISFGREAFDHLHTYYTDVESGDCYVLFNSTGHLQIGINKGNASQLLGLAVDAPIHIEFSS